MPTNQPITDKRKYHWRNRAQGILITESIMKDMGISLTSASHLFLLELAKGILEITSDLKFEENEEEDTDETH